MTNDPPQPEHSDPLPVDGVVYLESEKDRARRLQAEKDQQEEDHRKAILSLHERQTKATEAQATAAKASFAVSVAIAFLTIVGGLVSFLQFNAAKASAEAAQAAVKVASDTLDSGNESFDRQWVEMRAQARAMQRSATSSAESNRITQNSTKSFIAENRNALELEQRAYIIKESVGAFTEDGKALTTFKVDTPFRIAVAVRNIGRSPAFDNRGFIGVQAVPTPNRNATLNIGRALMNAIRVERRNPGLVGIAEDLAPEQGTGLIATPYTPPSNGAPEIWGRSQLFLIANDLMRALIRDEAAIVVAGVISYDTVGKPHETEFCIIYRSISAEAYTDCADHNTIR